MWRKNGIEEDRVKMARLRAGHNLELGAFKKRLGLGSSGLC